VPELDEESVRELALYSYRILYEIRADRVEVLAVIHKRNNLVPGELPREA
jgi:toxin ParE1/3/4